MNKVVALSEDVYKKLLEVKHKLEKENTCGFSFSKTINYLIKQEEKND